MNPKKPFSIIPGNTLKNTLTRKSSDLTRGKIKPRLEHYNAISR